MTCSVTEQRVTEHITRVTSSWKTPETRGARVVMFRGDQILARALENMARELFDAEGVPLGRHMAMMSPFLDDGSTRGSFRDRLTLDLLPYMSATGVLDDSCNTILMHMSKTFSNMGLDCVPRQGGLSHLQVVSSFKLAHSQVPICWDNSDKSISFVFVMPLQATTSVTYVSETALDVFGCRVDLHTELGRGDTVLSFGQSLYLSREMKPSRELVTSIVVAVYSIDSHIPVQHFTRPYFKAADDLAALTGVPPMQVCVACHAEIRDRHTDDLWGSKSIDIGKGFHCSDCREAFHIPALVCGNCRTGKFGEISALNRVKSCCLHNASSKDDPLGEFVNGWLQWEVSAVKLRAGWPPCLHGSLVPNNLGDALQNVLSLDEIRRAAGMFKQWYLFGNILLDAAPDELKTFFRESSDLSFLWPKWRELYVENSHCSRAVLAVNAVIGALSIGPLIGGLNSSSGKARKTTKAQPAFYGTLDDNPDELRSRLWIAARISSGLITKLEMQRMALKTLRHIQKGAWCSNFKCTCNIQSLDVSMSTRWDRHTDCRGPVLNLSIDQLVGTGAVTAEIRTTQRHWAQQMTTEEFSRYMSPKSDTDHRFW